MCLFTFLNLAPFSAPVRRNVAGNGDRRHRRTLTQRGGIAGSRHKVSKHCLWIQRGEPESDSGLPILAQKSNPESDSGIPPGGLKEPI